MNLIFLATAKKQINEAQTCFWVSRTYRPMDICLIRDFLTEKILILGIEF